MKKSKLSLGLVTSFIGALALSSCGSTPAVTSSDKSIVDFIGYDSEQLSVDIDKFYSEYGDSDESTTLFYNAVLEALIRYEYKGLSERQGTTLKSYDTLQADAKEKLDAQIRVAQDNASSNGTTYAEEMDKILESNDCETEDDLKQKYLYELEKSEITDWYYNSNKDQLMDEYIGLNNEWTPIAESEEHESVFPYHILHVLVKLGADASDYSRATITSAEAEKLWNVVRKLMDKSYSFEDVAFKESEDSSNTAYGDVGIMSTQTSFYNEFKLGVYAYDAILSGVNSEIPENTPNEIPNSAIYQAFGIDSNAKVTTQVINDKGVASETKEKVVDLVKEEMVEEVRNAVTGYGETPANQYAAIPTIPYDVFRKMYQWKDSEKIGDSIEPEAGATAYPRNVLFNQFLNFRSPFVITNEDISLEGSEQEQVTLTEHDFTSGDFRLANNNFKSGLVKNLGNTDKGNERKVLTDGNDNVIICVRSTAGIHFMVMRKSVFKNTNELAGKASVTLQDYYTTELPGSEDYPSETYVNMADYPSNPSYYTDRINTIKSKLKGTDSSDVFDAAYDYRIYEMLLDDELVKGKIKFFDAQGNESSVIAANIEKKIELLRLSKALSNEESINSSWQSYLAQLRHQNDIRNYKGMLPTTCAFSFSNKANANMYNKDRSEGGICNVK